MGYLETWAMYSTPDGMPTSLQSYLPKLTHVNYAFGSISYSTTYDSYYVDVTDPWADIGKCTTPPCPQVRRGIATCYVCFFLLPPAPCTVPTHIC